MAKRDQPTPPKRRTPVKPPKEQKSRPKEKKQPVKKGDQRELSAMEEDELELARIELESKQAVKITPGRLMAEKFLMAYLRTHSIYDAARAILDPELRKDKAHVAKIARKIWRSRLFQRMLDEHLEEFGKKTRRLKRMTVMVLERAMVEDRGLGSHGANVKAAETLSKILGMQEKKVAVKTNGQATHLLVVPGIANLEDWGTSALKAQEDLKKRVKDLHASNGTGEEEDEA